MQLKNYGKKKKLGPGDNTEFFTQFLIWGVMSDSLKPEHLKNLQISCF